MAKGYIIGHLNITNPEAFKTHYASKIPSLLEVHGGRILVRGGNVTYYEGDKADIDVVVEFSDVASARAFISSESYKEIEPARKENSEGLFMIIEGV